VRSSEGGRRARWAVGVGVARGNGRKVSAILTVEVLLESGVENEPETIFGRGITRPIFLVNKNI